MSSEKLIKTVALIKELQTIEDGRVRSRKIYSHILDNLDEELVASSSNICTLFRDTLNFNEKLLSRLRQTEWYDDWVVENIKYMRLDYNSISYEECGPKEKMTLLSQKEFDIGGLYKLIPILETDGEDYFIKAVTNYIINHGYKTDFDVIDIYNAGIQMTPRIAACMVVLNGSNLNFIEQKYIADPLFMETLLKINPIELILREAEENNG